MALAITSFPVPVSPWIKTAESTGATLSTSVSNARNFGLDPIKSKVVIMRYSFMNVRFCSAFTTEMRVRFRRRGTRSALRSAEYL